ncbi:MAG TPA: PDZ domain-containing protein [Burkholderiaceae bacterium]|jgi:predicted metalloprotease with PDZ domain|nr:PDZ domain-containing protein [Burkholderiaceae bacterium]
MKTEQILYVVEPHDLAGHRLRITLTIEQPDPEGQALALPAWIPGSYLIRDFARQVETLEARSGGNPVRVTKTDNHSWRCEPCAAPLTIEYVVYAWDLSVRGAHVDETHAFFNGTSVFLAVRGQEHLPCHVLLQAPAEAAHWTVHTSLPEADGHPQAAARHGFGMYRAPDYDALIDHPVEMGTPQVATFEACGAQHEMVFTGVAPNLDLDRIVEDTRRICEAQIAFFEPETLEAPFLDSSSRYVFMTMITGDGYGGLEHRASTALMCSRSDLPAKGRTEAGEGYENFLGLVSHEYFHTWNVKRIKPSVFAPYDLSRENHTRLLWVFEGFTSYYDDLFLLRAGVIDEAAYLKRLAKTITMVHRAPGRLKQSVAESSFDAWTRFYKQDENSPNALVSYYSKGSLVALGLDLAIRQASDDTRCLDDVLRLMWARHGRDFYRNGCAGVDESAMPQLIQEATGFDARDFLERYADGREDVPLAELLATQGISLIWKTPANDLGLDARLRSSNGQCSIATAYEGGAAHRAGLSAGDVIVAVDGLRVTDEKSLATLLSRHQPGDTVPVHVFRRDELRCYPLTLSAAPASECELRRDTPQNGDQKS